MWANTLLTLIIQKNSWQCFCPHKSQAQCSHSFLAKDKQKSNGKYYTAPYYYCGCFCECLYTTPVDNKVLHDVRKLCWSIGPGWLIKGTGDLLYMTLYSFLFSLMLFVCCVCSVHCHHFQFSNVAYLSFFIIFFCYSNYNNNKKKKSAYLPEKQI